MISSNTDHMPYRRLSKPSIDIVESLLVFILKATEVSAVNQNIALGNRQFSVPSMCVRDYTE